MFSIKKPVVSFRLLTLGDYGFGHTVGRHKLVETLITVLPLEWDNPNCFKCLKIIENDL